MTGIYLSPYPLPSPWEAGRAPLLLLVCQSKLSVLPTNSSTHVYFTVPDRKVPPAPVLGGQTWVVFNPMLYGKK